MPRLLPRFRSLYSVGRYQTALIAGLLLLGIFVKEVYIEQGLIWVAVIGWAYGFQALSQRMRPSLAFFLSAMVLSTVIGCFHPRSKLPGDYLSLGSLLFFLFSFLCGMSVNKLNLKWLARFVVIGNAGLLIFGSGFFYNPTINAFFSVFMACFCDGLIFNLVALGTAIMIGGATSSICLGIVSAILFLPRTVRGFLLPVACISILTLLLFANHNIAYLADRWAMWSAALRYWWVNYAPLGIGLGRFGAISPNVQLLAGSAVNPTQAWISLHNDWLQMLIELGGFFPLFAWLWVDLLMMSWVKNKTHFIALVLLATFMTVYFPLRIPIFWCLLGYLSLKNLRISYEWRRESISSFEDRIRRASGA